MSSDTRTQAPIVSALPSGMRVVMRPETANEIVSVLVFFPVPGAIERTEEAGLVQFTAAMMVRGTTSRTHAELAEAIDGLGISLTCSAADDYSLASLDCTSDTLEESLALLAEVILSPSFEPEEIEKERQSTLAAIRRRDDDRLAFAVRHMMQDLYAGHSYGLPRLGHAETVAEFTRDQILTVHGELLDAPRMLAVCLGHFEPSRMESRLAELFSGITGRGGEALQVAQPGPPRPGRRTLERPGEQAVLAAGWRACGLADPAGPAVRLLNAVAGEGMNSRLFQRLREQQGLAYATGSYVHLLVQGGHIVAHIGTRPDAREQALEGLLGIFAQLRRERVPREELDRARNYVTGKYLIDHQSNHRRAFYLGHYEMTGLGLAADEDFPERLARVTADDVLAAAEQFLGDATVAEVLPPE
ncbi:MAG: insulinase family protein [Candidatus Sumerlaeaceae bacterium]|nr:insulinase family protein [Candidatus Sumerlaeaceae bacterium]